MPWLLLSLLALGCARDPATPSCGDIADPGARDACHFDAARAALHDPVALDAVLARITDDGTHDTVVLRLVMAQPESAGQMCGRTRLAASRQKCALLQNRPHLTAPPP